MVVSTRNSQKLQEQPLSTDQGPSHDGPNSGSPDSRSLSPLSDLEENSAGSTAQQDQVDEAQPPRSPPIEIVAPSGTKATESSEADSAPGGCASTESSSHDGVVSTEVAQPAELAYREFLGGFSLSPASSSQAASSSSSSTTTEDEFLAMSLFTPIGSRMSYFSDPHRWNLFRPDADTTTRISTESDIVKAIFLSTSFASKRSLLMLEDPRSFKTQGKLMFLLQPHSKRADYAHIQLQTALLDRLVWCSLPRTTPSVRVNQGCSKKRSALPEPAQELLAACQKWQGHLASAATQILTYDWLSKKPDANLEREITSLDPNSAIVSLGMRLSQSKNNVTVQTIEQNFIAAAIALRALVEVSASEAILICLIS